MNNDDDLDEPLEGKLITFHTQAHLDMSEIGINFANPNPKNEGEAVPQIIDLKKTEKEFKEREEFVRTQKIVQSANEKINPLELSDLLIFEITEELSHLKWERQRLAKTGKYATNQSVSRISALKQLSEILAKRLETARNDRLDLRSPKFQQILNLWMNFLYESMKKVNLSDQDIDLVFGQMKADMIGWEQKILNPENK